MVAINVHWFKLGKILPSVKAKWGHLSTDTLTPPYIMKERLNMETHKCNILKFSTPQSQY